VRRRACSAGSHDVPGSELADRHNRLWPNIAAAAPHCHRIVFYDNATDNGPFEIAAFRSGHPDYPPRWPRWTPGPLLAL